MTLVLKQIKLYAKLTLFVALALVVVLVVFKNRDHRVTVWFFATYESINVLWLMLCSAAGAIVSWWVLAATRTVWRDMRDVYRATAAAREKEQMESRAKAVADAEKRIDQKLERTSAEDE